MNTLVLQPATACPSAATPRRAIVPGAVPREAMVEAAANPARAGLLQRLRDAAAQQRVRRIQARRLREEGALLMAMGQHELNDLGVGRCELLGHLGR
ncbi:hypothetical protein DFR41_101801 [Pseudacidovorax intermedius]|uniref:DUF1127 domain-containing protein n=2 Tax=Pseudacidovorax intermedius TaxID=433924 RepID=A0A370FPR6_9BURK|nr:hypothetical protein [Pseudacidovorax intermedius]RDI29045.1 hypothetical protein DFR41_101801 [Pseudacidovorax intermedius]